MDILVNTEKNPVDKLFPLRKKKGGEESYFLSFLKLVSSYSIRKMIFLLSSTENVRKKIANKW